MIHTQQHSVTHTPCLHLCTAPKSLATQVISSTKRNRMSAQTATQLSTLREVTELVLVCSLKLAQPGRCLQQLAALHLIPNTHNTTDVCVSPRPNPPSTLPTTRKQTVVFVWEMVSVPVYSLKLTQQLAGPRQVQLHTSTHHIHIHSIVPSFTPPPCQPSTTANTNNTRTTAPAVAESLTDNQSGKVRRGYTDQQTLCVVVGGWRVWGRWVCS